MFKEIEESHRQVHESALAMATLLAEVHDLVGGRAEVARIYAEDTVPALQKVQGLLHKIAEEARSHAVSDAAMLAAANSTRRNVLLIVIVAVVASMVLASLLARSIARPIKEAVGFADAMSKGDLSHKLDIEQKDEMGVLAKALNTMASNLRRMLRDVAGGVETLSSSSGDLSAISQQMCSGAEQTSGKANTVASAAEKMSSNMSSVAAATEEASTNVGIVATSAEEMTATINEIA